MALHDVIEIVQLFNQHGIEFYIDGGWGVDALLGEQTRPHADLDIAIQHKDSLQVCALLEARGYSEVYRDDSSDFNFVVSDYQGHQIDIHTYTFDTAGNHIYGIAYPLESLSGRGSLDGYPVKCISLERVMHFWDWLEWENGKKSISNGCQQWGVGICRPLLKLND